MRPGGLSGLQAARQSRRVWPGLGPRSKLKCVVLEQNVFSSGEGEVENIKKGQQHPGFSHFLRNLVAKFGS